MSTRRTVAGPARVRGAGLFSGAPAEVVIHPDTHGIVFRRTDLPGSPTIPANPAAIVDDPRRFGLPLPVPARSTTLTAGPGGPVVLTVEHILSALFGLGITDARVDLDGPEIPIGDGSAGAFVDALVAAGTSEIGPGNQPIVPAESVTVGDERVGTVTAAPRARPGCSFRYELDYGPGAPIPAQAAQWSPGDDYAAAVAPARTFCLAAEAEAMRAAGLFSKLTPRDMLVIGPSGPIENAYRFPDEPARHKLLDLIGDLALAGGPIQADFVARRSGHALNHALCRALVRA